MEAAFFMPLRLIYAAEFAIIAVTEDSAVFFVYQEAASPEDTEESPC